MTNTQSGKSRATAPAKTVAGVPRPKEKTRGSYRQQNGCDISIAVTSYALDGEEKIAKAAGCDDYVPKPYSPRELLAKIRQHLS